MWLTSNTMKLARLSLAVARASGLILRLAQPRSQTQSLSFQPHFDVSYHGRQRTQRTTVVQLFFAHQWTTCGE